MVRKTNIDRTILERYDAGWSMSYIARMLGISKDLVKVRLLRYNRTIRPASDYNDTPRLSQEEAYKTMLLYQEGELSMRGVAERLGVSYSTVHYRLTRMGVRPRTTSEAVTLAIAKGRLPACRGFIKPPKVEEETKKAA